MLIVAHLPPYTSWFSSFPIIVLIITIKTRNQGITIEILMANLFAVSFLFLFSNRKKIMVNHRLFFFVNLFICFFNFVSIFFFSLSIINLYIYKYNCKMAKVFFCCRTWGFAFAGFRGFSWVFVGFRGISWVLLFSPFVVVPPPPVFVPFSPAILGWKQRCAKGGPPQAVEHRPGHARSPNHRPWRHQLPYQPPCRKRTSALRPAGTWPTASCEHV